MAPAHCNYRHALAALAACTPRRRNPASHAASDASPDTLKAKTASKQHRIRHQTLLQCVDALPSQYTAVDGFFTLCVRGRALSPTTAALRPARTEAIRFYKVCNPLANT